jgi:hypothetical protein
MRSKILELSKNALVLCTKSLNHREQILMVAKQRAYELDILETNLILYTQTLAYPNLSKINSKMRETYLDELLMLSNQYKYSAIHIEHIDKSLLKFINESDAHQKLTIAGNPSYFAYKALFLDRE